MRDTPPVDLGVKEEVITAPDPENDPVIQNNPATRPCHRIYLVQKNMIEAVRDTFWELFHATKGPGKVGRPKVQAALPGSPPTP